MGITQRVTIMLLAAMGMLACAAVTKWHTTNLIEKRVYAYYGIGDSARISHYLQTGDTIGVEWKQKRNFICYGNNTDGVIHVTFDIPRSNDSLPERVNLGNLDLQKYTRLRQTSISF